MCHLGLWEIVMAIFYYVVPDTWTEWLIKKIGRLSDIKNNH